MIKTSQIIKGLLISFTFLLTINSFSQDLTELGTKRVKYYSAEDYNGHSQNWSVFQDKRGMLYFGNNDGILEFDGVTWRRIAAFPVRCFSQGKGSRIYSGGDNEFGYFEKDAKGATIWFSYSKQLPEDKKNYLSMLSIQQEGNKTIFVGFRGIYIYEKDSLIKIIRPQTDFRFSFKYNERIFLRQTDVGLMELKNDSVFLCSHGDFFADKPVYMFERYDDDHAVVATKLTGLFLVNIRNLNKKELPVDSIYRKFNTDADKFFETNNIYHGVLLANGDFALGSTVAGVIIINRNGKVKRVFNKQSGLPVNNVNYVFCDRENNVWLALNNGLAYIEMNSPMNYFGEETGYQGLCVGAINFKGKFYVGTLEGLYVLSFNPDITSKTSSFYRFKRLTTDYNSFMQLDTIDGKLYAAARYGFFEIEDEKVKTIKRMEFSYAILHSKKDPSIVYVNNSEGLAIFKKMKGELKFFEQIGGIEHEVRYIYEDIEGSLWINGNNNDILKLTFKNRDLVHPTITRYGVSNGLPNSSAPAIIKNIDYLSVLIPGMGYYKYYSEKSPVGKQNYFYPDPKFPNKIPGTNDSILYYLATKYDDSTWYSFTATQGLIKIISNNTEATSVKVLSSSLGQANVTFFMYSDIEHQLLWYSTNKGLFSYKLNVEITKPPDFITIIREIVVGKDSILYVSGDSSFVTSIPFTKNSLTFNFSTLYYQGIENNSFQYYLEGLDETWLDWTKEKYISYNFLPDGEYVFHVKGKNANGIESREAVFHFVILPPWYKTWWAILIYFVGFVLTVILSVVLYSKRLKKQNEKLEEIIDNRTAEIKRQNSEIEQKNKQLGEVNKQLEKLSIVASETENSVMIMDANANFEWVNDGFKKLYGYTLEELISEHGNNLKGYSRNPEIGNLINNCIKQKNSVQYETVIYTRENKELWAHTTLTPIIDKEGNVQKIVAIDSDITKLKTIELKLTEQNEEIQSQNDLLEEINTELEKLSIVASQTDNTVMIMDKDTNFIWINESLLNRYNKTFDEFVKLRGKSLLEASYNPNIKAIIKKCIQEKKSVFYESEFKSVDGKIKWTQTTLTPIIDTNGHIKNLVAIDSDITKIKKAEEKIKLQSEELEQNLSELSKKNLLITNSIEYARKIQEAILPSKQEFKEIFNESFVFFKPRDVVSGDFFWVHTQDGLHFAAVADCTGHGVPGAFMSIIGNTLLNEIVKEKKISQPARILDLLNQGVMKALHQNDLTQSSQDDGMDITFIVFDPSKKKLYISLAGHIAILKTDKDFKRIEGDMYAIGGAFNNRNNVSFTEYSFTVNKDSQIFLYSDGYQDQFGGDSNSKYMAESFEKYLKSICLLNIDDQLKQIEANFNQWMGNDKQIDDVLVIGVKFSDI